MQASNIKTLKVVSKYNIETKLKRMQALKENLYIIEAEYDMLKREVINEHFVNNEEYVTTKGLVLATYKAYTQNMFDTTTFKREHSEMALQYTVPKTIHKFLLK